MKVKHVTPQKKHTELRRHEENPLVSLRTEMNRLFESFFRTFDLEPFWTSGGNGDLFAPRVNVSEDDTTVKISAELPGMDEKGIEVVMTDDMLTIKGEKKEEKEEKEKDFIFSERRYGSFRRDVPLPVEVVPDKAEATFKNGVLTVTLPKTEKSKKERKKIPVKAK